MKTTRKKLPHINSTTGLIAMQRQLPLILPAILPIIITGAVLTGCTPSVKVEAPEKPITINLNVKIEHEIRVKVDRELEDVFSEDSGLF